MKITYLIIAMFLCTVTFAAAAPDIAQDGMIVYELKVGHSSISNQLALILDKGVYDRGSNVSVILGSSIPCNTKYATLRVESTSASQLYSKDVSSLVSPCTTSYISTKFTAPNTVGAYNILLDLKDATGQIIYTDRTTFTVKDPVSGLVCTSLGSCQDWTKVQAVENGQLEQKSCYVYDQATCVPKAYVYTRTVCKVGYVLTNGFCVLPNNQAQCGDLVVQSGEQCDLGNLNGPCPSTCNSMCRTSQCQALPTPTTTTPTTGTPAPNTPAVTTPETNSHLGLIIVVIVAVLLMLGGAYYLWRG